MRKILTEISPTGVQHNAYTDGDELVLEEFTPTSIEAAVLQDAAQIRNDLSSNKKASFRHAATVPVQIYQAWRREWREKWADTYTWKTFFVMKLNSVDWKNLRTLAGKL